MVIITAVALLAGFLLWNSESREDLIGTPEGGWPRGPENAPVTLHAYADFECGVCIDKEILSLEAIEKYPGQVRLVYHHYPSDDTEDFSFMMAEALEAAGAQGENLFWALHDAIIYEPPDNITELRTLAADAGVDMPEFDEALETRKYKDKVREAKEIAKNDNDVDEVSLFVNNRKYTGFPGTLDQLSELIDEELAKSGGNDSD